MGLNIENIPYISLGWIGIGFLLLIIGIFMLACRQEKNEDYTGYDEHKELFSFFLQEEEKKNDAIRNSIKMPTNKPNEDIYDAIIRMHKENKPPEDIAKQMKIGVGEVKLILSLYSMR